MCPFKFQIRIKTYHTALTECKIEISDMSWLNKRTYFIFVLTRFPLSCQLFFNTHEGNRTFFYDKLFNIYEFIKYKNNYGIFDLKKIPFPHRVFHFLISLIKEILLLHKQNIKKTKLLAIFKSKFSYRTILELLIFLFSFGHQIFDSLISRYCRLHFITNVVPLLKNVIGLIF